MGIFTRFKDIISSNINATLDKAEDPKKMIRLMIQEMEETLVEMKSQCAKSMAARKKLERELAAEDAVVEGWERRAELAVDKGRDDLAREALLEKKNAAERVDALKEEMLHMDALVEQAKDDIDLLEEKLMAAKEKQRMLLHRHARANVRKDAGMKARKADGADAAVRFEKFEQRIERLEAEAELMKPKKSPGLEEEFARLENEEGIESELAALKERMKKE